MITVAATKTVIVITGRVVVSEMTATITPALATTSALVDLKYATELIITAVVR